MSVEFSLLHSRESTKRNICALTPAALESLSCNTAREKFLVCLWLLFSPLQISHGSFLTLWAKSKVWRTVVFSCTEKEWRFVWLFGTGNSGFVQLGNITDVARVTLQGGKSSAFRRQFSLIYPKLPKESNLESHRVCQPEKCGIIPTGSFLLLRTSLPAKAYEEYKVYLQTITALMGE